MRQDELVAAVAALVATNGVVGVMQALELACIEQAEDARIKGDEAGSRECARVARTVNKGLRAVIKL